MRRAGLLFLFAVAAAPVVVAVAVAAPGDATRPASARPQVPRLSSEDSTAYGRKLDEILARREFRTALRESGVQLELREIERPPFFQWLADHVRDWLRSVVRWLRRLLERKPEVQLPRGSLVSAWSTPATWMLAAAVAILLLFILLRARWRRPSGSAPEQGGVVVEGPGNGNSDDAFDALARPAESWARLSDRFAHEGQWRLALRAAYLELLVRLHERGVIHYRPQRTNGDYVAVLRGTPAAEPFTALTRAFDHAWYGNKPFEVGDFHAARAWTRQVDAATVQGSE